MNTERRIFQGKIEVRESAGGGHQVHGMAARYNSLSVDLGGFKERIAPGAFRSVLKNCDCRCLVNHDPNKILGRTKSGTLQLQETEGGLYFMCDMPNVSFASDLYESMRRGDMDQCSFGFRIAKGDDDWDDEGVDDDGNRCVIRTIRNFATLEDVSVVTFPAYPSTSAFARNLVPDAVLAEVRSRAARHVTPSRTVELVSAEERREILGQPTPEQLRRDVEQVQRDIYKELL